MAKQISDLKLGILGGGQLGRMLIQEAIKEHGHAVLSQLKQVLPEDIGFGEIRMVIAAMPKQ